MTILRPICWLIGHKPIPAIDCDGVVFGKVCCRCLGEVEA